MQIFLFVNMLFSAIHQNRRSIEEKDEKDRTREKERTRRKTITMKSSFHSIGERTDVRTRKKCRRRKRKKKQNGMAKGE